MSCDIHAVIEFDTDGEPPFSRDAEVFSFSGGTVSLERDYDVFAALAGVRLEGDFEPLYRPRGVPPSFSTTVSEELFLDVLDEDEVDWRGGQTVSREEADLLVSRKQSAYADRGLRSNRLVTDPQFHSISWLSLSELKLALTHASLLFEGLPWMYQVAIETMESIDRKLGEGRSRLVFWFDN